MEFTIGQYNDNGNYMLHLEKNPVICNIAVVHHRKSSEYEFNNTGNFYNEIKSYWNIGKKIIDEQGGKDTAEYGKELIIIKSSKQRPRTSIRDL